MSAYRYPVVRIDPTGAVVVAEHLTLQDARDDAAWRDLEAGPNVWHHADEPECSTDNRRAA